LRFKNAGNNSQFLPEKDKKPQNSATQSLIEKDVIEKRKNKAKE